MFRMRIKHEIYGIRRQLSPCQVHKFTRLLHTLKTLDNKDINGKVIIAAMFESIIDQYTNEYIYKNSITLSQTVVKVVMMLDCINQCRNTVDSETRLGLVFSAAGLLDKEFILNADALLLQYGDLFLVILFNMMELCDICYSRKTLIDYSKVVDMVTKYINFLKLSNDKSKKLKSFNEQFNRLFCDYTHSIDHHNTNNHNMGTISIRHILLTNLCIEHPIGCGNSQCFSRSMHCLTKWFQYIGSKKYSLHRSGNGLRGILTIPMILLNVGMCDCFNVNSSDLTVRQIFRQIRVSYYTFATNVHKIKSKYENCDPKCKYSVLDNIHNVSLHINDFKHELLVLYGIISFTWMNTDSMCILGEPYKPYLAKYVKKYVIPYLEQYINCNSCMNNMKVSTFCKDTALICYDFLICCYAILNDAKKMNYYVSTLYHLFDVDQEESRVVLRTKMKLLQRCCDKIGKNGGSVFAWTVVQTLRKELRWRISLTREYFDSKSVQNLVDKLFDKNNTSLYDNSSYQTWKNLTMIKECKYCFNKSKVLRKCKICRNAYYCSKSCQKKDWIYNNHKEECISNR